MRTERAESFGGVVYRRGTEGIEVIVVGRKDPGIYGLPKGTPNPGETMEETALREVREETGVETEIEQKIDAIEYWFVRAAIDTRFHKFVHFYLMRPIGGDTSLHDHEHDVVEWLPLAEAKALLTYQNEVRVLDKAESLLAQSADIESN
ncbi:MAG TPA: NUDIX hydrolase [Chloroflexota bacterium]|nr:NUDIX hydrolase [Chloroflexota bacterium]